MIKESKKRYKEEFEEGSELLWPSEKEDSITRKFYRDISHLSKKSNIQKYGLPSLENERDVLPTLKIPGINTYIPKVTLPLFHV